jgi:hypothetical protein
MAYFEDLTPYTYCRGEEYLLNVGWLASPYPFRRGPVAYQFAARLFHLADKPVRLMRGLHYCDFCKPPQDIIDQDPSYMDVWEMNRCGSGEIRVKHSNGVCYSAPTLIWHYIVEHQYQPPQQFIDALIWATDNPDSQPAWDASP